MVVPTELAAPAPVRRIEPVGGRIDALARGGDYTRRGVRALRSGWTLPSRSCPSPASTSATPGRRRTRWSSRYPPRVTRRRAARSRRRSRSWTGSCSPSAAQNPRPGLGDVLLHPMLRRTRHRRRIWAVPQPHEVRFMAFNALVHRANGILYFSYWPRATITWASVTELNKDIERVVPRLLASARSKRSRRPTVRSKAGPSVSTAH